MATNGSAALTIHLGVLFLLQGGFLNSPGHGGLKIILTLDQCVDQEQRDSVEK